MIWRSLMVFVSLIGGLYPASMLTAQSTTRIQTERPDARNLVADIVITGNRLISKQMLMRDLATRPGRVFDADLLQQDVDRLWRLPQVKRIKGPFLKQTDRGIIITIEIQERQMIQKIEFVGNRGITDRTLKKETGLEDGQPLDLHAIRMAKTRIEELYRDKGYPRTQVEILQQDQIEQGHVIFLIHEDRKQKIWRVQFEGNTFVPDGRLKSLIQSKPGVLKVIGGNAKRDEIDQDVLRLASYYKSFGYFNVRIGREIEESNDGRWLTVRFIIDEGPRYRIRNISFVGPKAHPPEELAQLLHHKPTAGERPEFSATQMNKDVVALRELYGSEGYVFAKIEAEPRFLEEPGLLDLVYRIDEGEQYYVGKINVHIEGDYGVTKREVVLNRLSLRPGQLINANEIRNSERLMGSAQIFATGGAGGGRPPKIVVRTPEMQELDQMQRAASQSSAAGHLHSGSGAHRH